MPGPSLQLPISWPAGGLEKEKRSGLIAVTAAQEVASSHQRYPDDDLGKNSITEVGFTTEFLP